MCLRDPFNSKNTFVIPLNVFHNIICHLDGNHSIMDIQDIYTQRHGDGNIQPMIQQVVQELDKNLLLENDRSRDFIEKAKDDFKHSTIRKDAHAGTAYEADKESLKEQLDKFFVSTDGPGKPSPNKTTGLKGIIAPHIDIGCGGPCFAWAYKEIAESSDAELFIILGIAHTGTKNLFALTNKTFETPFGNVETDKDFLDSLHKKNKTDYFEDEFIHKDEHSIGFQLIFLQYLYHRKKDFSIIPILCSSFGEAEGGNNSSNSKQTHQFEEFVSSLRETIKESSKKICIIASVDLAHVGTRFGDTEPQDEAYLERLRSDDIDMLKYAEKVDADGFNNLIRKDNNSRKICGYPAIYTLLNIIKASEGKLLKYSQYADQTNSTVSFASMAFY